MKNYKRMGTRKYIMQFNSGKLCNKNLPLIYPKRYVKGFSFPSIYMHFKRKDLIFYARYSKELNSYEITYSVLQNGNSQNLNRILTQIINIQKKAL